MISRNAVVVQPGESPSYWQPVPASGHADPILTPRNTGFGGLSMGYQTIAPGGHVREHAHTTQVEFQICFRGRGYIVIDGETHPLVPGTACFIAPGVKEAIWNNGDEDLVMMWVITPPGLESFFATIGRWRRPGDPAPPPFPRRDDIADVERRMGIDTPD